MVHDPRGIMLVFLHVVGCPRRRRRQRLRARLRCETSGGEVGRRPTIEDPIEIVDVVRESHFVERDPDRAVAEVPQVDRFGESRAQDRGRFAIRTNADRVEVHLGENLMTEVPQAAREHAGQIPNPLRDPTEAFGAVVDRIRPGHDREEHLCRADVRRRLLPPDVLLPRLERHAQRRIAIRVHRYPDDASRQLPLERLARRHESGVGAAEAHGYAEPL
jgi:hypothetical protein